MSVAPKNPNQKLDFLDEALMKCKQVMYYVFAFSFAANILMLATPIYSMQVLDRVLSSGSEATLLMLSLLVTVMFLALCLITVAKSFAMTRVGEWLDRQVAPKLMALTLATAAQRGGIVSGSQNIRDFANVKGFLTGQAMNTLMDVPWSPVFLIVIFIIHPVQGIIGIVGAIILVLMAVLNESVVRKTLESANENSVRSLGVAEIATRNAEAVEAMGMTNSVVNSWNKRNIEVSELQMLAGNRSSVISSTTKFIRLFLQLVVLGVGTYLTLQHQMTSGAIIACSILIGRALAPFEAAIATWKALADARKSYSRLKASIEKAPARFEGILLPEPKGQLVVEKLVFAPPGSNRPTIKSISFGINPGDVLGVIGSSAAGKTTLAKLIVGVWKPVSGAVRLDGADVYTWNREQFGKYVGYLPQDVELFDGTVRQNIGRMQPEASDEMVIEAAKMAGVHDLVLRLPDGYDTQIGIGGAALSAGQRQRVALARAFFGTPKLIVLDEPNANLDSAGELALVGAINNAKKNNITTVIISHRPNILNAVDKVLVMNDGQIEDFGSAAEVAAKYTRNTATLQQQQQNIQISAGKPANDAGEGGKPQSPLFPAPPKDVG